MSKVALTDLERLVTDLIFPFYQIERLTPFRFAPGRHENDAEHSWSLAVFACAFAPHIDAALDTGKICQFATVHDLLEVYTGDIINFTSDEVKALKIEKESEALKQLQSDFAEFAWITETVTAYEQQQTAEARFVKATDKFLLLLFDLIEEGLCNQEEKISREAWRAFMQRHREKTKVYTAVFVYYDEIWNRLLDHPEFFWQDSSGP